MGGCAARYCYSLITIKGRDTFWTDFVLLYTIQMLVKVLSVGSSVVGFSTSNHINNVKGTAPKSFQSKFKSCSNLLVLTIIYNCMANVFSSTFLDSSLLYFLIRTPYILVYQPIYWIKYYIHLLIRWFEMYWKYFIVNWF